MRARVAGDPGLRPSSSNTASSLRVLHHLRTEVLEPSPGVLTGILAGLAEAGEQRAIHSRLRGHRAAYIGGMAVATAAAGAAGAAVLVSRASRRRVGPLAG